MEQARDHIFISYATEQSALCDWLARRLATEGYAVWCDRQKLLGGENWINDIDSAINQRTFRMIALLSRVSTKKPRPQGEWQKGISIGNKLGIEDFVIPLNTDGLRPEEIPWHLQSINYIPFRPSWAEGLDSLLKKLKSIDAPRILNNGTRLAVESIVATSAIRSEPETLLSNCFEITQIPRLIHKYKTASKLSNDERWALQKEWACRDVSPSLVLAFDDPPVTVTENFRFWCVNQVSWRDTNLLNGIDTRHLVVSLIHKCLAQLLAAKGMKYCDVNDQWYLPQGLLDNNRVTFTFPNGKKSWFMGVSERKYRTINGGELYRYHMSPSFAILDSQADPYVTFLRNRVYLTNECGKPLEKQKILSRRKHLCKTWFNKEWCARTLGIAQLLADNDMYIRFGPTGEQQLIINAMPIAPNAPRLIHDELVDKPDNIYTEWHEDNEEEVDSVEMDE